MKTSFARALCALSLCAWVRHGAAQGTAFTYQGQIYSGGSPVSGSYDLVFTLYNTNLTGVAVAPPVTNRATPVSNGLFTTLVDFGPGVFTGASNWLAIAVSTNGANMFTPLAPRQQVTPTPYALNAGSAASANAVSAANVNGTLGLAQLPATVVTNSATTVNLAGTFTGNGGGLTNLAAWQLAGNAGTANGNYLGTADNQPLEIRVGGARAGLISPSNGSPNIVLGPAQNVISNTTAGSSILGGATNLIEAGSSFSVLGGGSGNSIWTGDDHSVLGGGGNNTIQFDSDLSFLGGGSLNVISSNASLSVLAGGYGNSIQYAAAKAFLGGGYLNSIQNGGSQSVLGGGSDNTIQADGSFLGAGGGNSIAGASSQSVLGGGFANSIGFSAGYSVLGGGTANNIGYNAGTSFLGGGAGNKIQSADSVLVGGSGNTVAIMHGFLGGGDQNSMVSGQFCALVGGYQNGIQNGYYDFLGGGLNNTNGGSYAFLGGGQFNGVGGNASWATLAGGYQNSATANYATVPGGSNNLASGVNSFAAGSSAQATNAGAFVWSDAEGTPFTSTNANSFNVRASGGARFVTGGAGLTVDGQPVLTGNVSFAQLLAEVVTNNEPTVSLGSLSLSGLTVTDPTTINASVRIPFYPYHQTEPLLYSAADNNNLFLGLEAGGASGANGYENTGIGRSVLAQNISGNYNTGEGYQALYSNTNGSSNTAMGQMALFNNSSGSNNVAVGVSALANTTTDSGLVAIGYQALQNDAASGSLATLGGANTAVGYQSLLGNGPGAANTGLGYQTLFSNSTGNNNTALGALALAAATGSGNIGIGSLAGFALAAGNNNIDIGNTGASGDSGVTRLGTPGSQTSAFIAGVINGDGSGLTNLNAAHFSTAVVTNNEPVVFLGTLALTGNLWLPAPATISSGYSPMLSADLNANSYFGLSAGAANVGAGGSENTGIGAQALTATSNGASNTAVGYHAMAGNQFGSGSTAIGVNALQNVTISGNNLAIGYNAGINLLIGSQNIYLGNPGSTIDSGIIRIGTPGLQTQTFIAGVIQDPSVTTLNITGGSDLAEPFSISTLDQPVAEGAVVVIDEAHPGQLKLTDRPYDTRVAGVVSGANGIHPGIQMHQQGLLEGGKNVALTGRVYVQADTSNGPIQPGDLLTTSGAPGRAMRVTDHAKAAGAILGKAMSALNAGQGMVLVLVTLQ